MNAAALRPVAVLVLCAVGAIAAPQAALADSITATCAPGPCGIWQRENVRLSWAVDVQGAASTTGCELFTFTADGVQTRTCRAFDTGMTEIFATTVSVRIDRTPPTVTGVSLTPAANALGWFTSPVRGTFQGIDPANPVASGIVTCTETGYAGPDSAAASVSGTCTDRAGNVSASFMQPLRYDATAPALGDVTAEAGDRMVRLRWSGAESPVEIVRTPGVGTVAGTVVFTGDATSFADRRVTNQTVYRYDVTVTDPAGNRTVRAITARPARRVVAPANGERVTAPPVIRWSEVPGATYYNVQVFHGGRKVLSAWPRGTSYRMSGRWRFAGRRLRLDDGAYRVYVWPGFGAFAKQRYGRIVGTVTFVKR